MLEKQDWIKNMRLLYQDRHCCLAAEGIGCFMHNVLKHGNAYGVAAWTE
jgi:hypothetical protein